MQGLPSGTLAESALLFDRSFVPSPQKCSEEDHRLLLHFSATAASTRSDTTQSVQSIYTNSKYEATSLTVWGFPSSPLLWSHSNLVVERTFTRELRRPTRQSPPGTGSRAQWFHHSSNHNTGRTQHLWLLSPRSVDRSDGNLKLEPLYTVGCNACGRGQTDFPILRSLKMPPPMEVQGFDDKGWPFRRHTLEQKLPSSWQTMVSKFQPNWSALV